MKRLLVAIALLCVGCAPSSTTAPTPIQSASRVPTTISMSALPGIGSSAGTVVIVATVTDASGHGVSAMVRFATTAGTMQPENVLADPGGLAQASVVTNSTATITASAGSASGRLDVTPNAPVVIPPQPPSTAPPPAPSIPLPAPSPAPTNPGSAPMITLGPIQVVAGTATTLYVNPSMSDGARISSWAWDFGDGTLANTTSATLSHTYAAAGTYPVKLTATDGTGRTASAISSATVTAPPAPPAPTTPAPPSTVMVLAMNCPTPTTKSIVCNLAATVGDTAIPSSQIRSVDWDWGDGQIGTTVPLGTHTYAQAGTYLVIASAIGNTGSSTQRATATKSITIQ